MTNPTMNSLPAASPARGTPPQWQPIIAVPPRPPRAANRAVEFAFLCAAYARTGGIARADRLVLDGQRDPSIGTVARWIVTGEVVSLDWAGDHWLPMFQFPRARLDREAAMQAPLAELRPVLDNWGIAHWFSSANCMLGGETPAEAIAATPQEVHQAARALRYLVQG